MAPLHAATNYGEWNIPIPALSTPVFKIKQCNTIGQIHCLQHNAPYRYLVQTILQKRVGTDGIEVKYRVLYSIESTLPLAKVQRIS